MSETAQHYEETLKELGEIKHRDMLYGRWLVNECEDCHITQHVNAFADTSGKNKEPIYLCRSCYRAGLDWRKPLKLRPWRAEDDKA